MMGWYLHEIFFNVNITSYRADMVFQGLCEDRNGKGGFEPATGVWVGIRHRYFMAAYVLEHMPLAVPSHPQLFG